MEFKIYNTPQKGNRFLNDLLEIRENKCECCGNNQWLDKPIKLQVHHIDGNKCNCQEDNLQLLCPNCHAYTDNFGIKNLKHNYISDEVILSAIPQYKNMRQLLLGLGMSDAGSNYIRVRNLLANNPNISFLKEEINKCPCCGEFISSTAKYCQNCYNQNRKEIIRPSREELKILIRTKSFVSIGKTYGVSDNAIRKWCDDYSLPRKKRDIKKYTDEQWEEI